MNANGEDEMTFQWFPVSEQEVELTIRGLRAIVTFQEAGEVSTVTPVPVPDAQMQSADFTINVHDAVGPDQLLTDLTNNDLLVADSGGNQTPVVDPNATVSFFNNTDFRVRLTFFHAKPLSDPANAATKRFDLPLWGEKPCLEIGPHQHGTAIVSSESENTPGVWTGIWIKIDSRESDGSWMNRSGGGNGANMGINNP